MRGGARKPTRRRARDSRAANARAPEPPARRRPPRPARKAPPRAAASGDLEALLDAIPLPILLTRDRGATRLHANLAGHALLRTERGSNVSKATASGSRLGYRVTRGGADVPPEDMPVRVAAREGRPVEGYAFEIRFDDGTVHHLVGNASPLLDARGRPAGAVGAFLDVTDRKQLEEARHAAELAGALRASEEILRQALDGSTDGHFDADLRNGRIRVSPRWNEIAGRPAGLTHVDRDEWDGMVHPDDVAPNAPAMAAVIDGRTDRLDITYRIRTGDGAWRWVRTRAKVVERDAGGPPTRMAGTTTDVHGQKVAEEALAASERRHRQLLDLLPDGAIVYRDGRIVAANPAAARLHGAATAEEVLGMSAADFLDAESMAVTREQIERGLAGLGMEARKIRIRGLDGTLRLAEAKGAPLPDDGHATIQVVLRDLTERQAMEQTLAVSSRLAAVGTLVAGVAHEINNPLSGALASHGFAAEELREARAALLGGEPVERVALARKLGAAADALADAQAAEQRIARIVRELVAFGRSDIRRERLRLRQVVDLGVRWVPASLGGHARIDVVDEGAPEVEGLSGQLAQVVLNLVTNACKAGRDGRPPRVTVRIGRGATGTALLEVEDEGTGMPPDVLERVFDPFFTTRDVGQGMGLGLSVSHAIVTGHGGTISATSEVGRGSAFRVVLPAAPSPE